ncbi:sulfite exporter TauE/SafE family protein [Aridibaculum aurantiacum]|uniref:sulfite exporter TauE/SafE family protein n=1 Tax=Aridibaculum aurantiacum TaxID=2810307 RepID=UPI002104F4D8|nr:sulfite exporter TauE/SafE family protein [Aridibaculum aurantiacum]
MSLQTILMLVLIGIAAGMLSGMVGIGGGIIIVPALVFLLAFSQKSAQGTTLGLLMFPVGVLGVLNYYKQGYVDFKVVIFVALGFILGSYFGSKISLGMSEEKVKRFFAIVIMLIAIKMLFFDRRKSPNIDGSPNASITSKEETTGPI